MTRVEPSLLYGSDGSAHGHIAPSDWETCESVRVWNGWLLPEDDLERRARADAEMLPWFLRLANAGDEEIARYMVRYGFLGLCAHGTLPVHQPEGHGLDDPAYRCQLMSCYDHEEILVSNNLAPIEESRLYEVPGVERAEDWRRLSRQAARLLEVGAIESPTPRQSMELHQLVDEWIEGADVRPAMDWIGRPRRVVLSGDTGLSAALALALLYAVVGGGPGLRQCANCTEWFPQTPRQRAALRVWCTEPECQRAKGAMAARNHRRRRRGVAIAA